jgi:hypothetical protein
MPNKFSELYIDSNSDSENETNEIVNPPIKLNENEEINPKIQQIHLLNRKWNLWYHDPNNTCYTLDSYINLGVIDSIESFWHYFYQLKLTQLQNGMFFLMLNGILPTWEDNLKGGFWSYKIDKKEIAQAWTKLSIHLLSDNFVENYDDDITKKSDYNDEIIGISISPKKTFSILKVWVNDDKVHHEIKLNQDLPYINNEEPIYRSHIETKEKEDQLAKSSA